MTCGSIVGMAQPITAFDVCQTIVGTFAARADSVTVCWWCCLQGQNQVLDSDAMLLHVQVSGRQAGMVGYQCAFQILHLQHMRPVSGTVAGTVIGSLQGCMQPAVHEEIVYALDPSCGAGGS
jgi:hypothetical protein